MCFSENRSNKNILQSNCVLPYNSYSTWYHETNVQSKPRPSTLVWYYDEFFFMYALISFWTDVSLKQFFFLLFIYLTNFYIFNICIYNINLLKTYFITMILYIVNVTPKTAFCLSTALKITSWRQPS